MLNKEVILSNDEIEVVTTGSYYDFIATVENKTSSPMTVHPGEVEATVIDEESGEKYNAVISGEPFVINAHDWVGILANDDGYATLEAFKTKNFTVEVDAPEKKVAQAWKPKESLNKDKSDIVR